MRNWVIILTTIAFFSCKNEMSSTYFTPEKANTCFRKIEDICSKDNGELWGDNLAGPLMFVDRQSRLIIANQPDKEGFLKLKDGIYTGVFPREKIINTDAVEFGGTLFAITPLPLEEDDFRIKTRAIHALFHRLQYLKGIHNEYFNAINMDEQSARIWIKLEWKALQKAITAEGEEQKMAIRDALIFRGSIHESFPSYTEMNTRFETYEGLSTFTYLLLVTESPKEFETRLFEYLERIYDFQSYARSYGSIHGALYATLMKEKLFDFKTLTPGGIDLGSIVKELYQVELPAVCRDVAGSISINYDISEITAEEEQRILEIKKRQNDQLSVFIAKPVVFLELESPSFDFEPEDVQYLDTLGTLYHSMRISDNCGKLTVDKTGCLVSNNYKYLRITAKGLKIERNHVSGDGWHIIMNDGWQISETKENFILKKLEP